MEPVQPQASMDPWSNTLVYLDLRRQQQKKDSCNPRSQVRFIQDEHGALRYGLDSDDSNRAIDLLKDSAKAAWILRQYQDAGGSLEDL